MTGLAAVYQAAFLDMDLLDLYCELLRLPQQAIDLLLAEPLEVIAQVFVPLRQKLSGFPGNVGSLGHEPGFSSLQLVEACLQLGICETGWLGQCAAIRGRQREPEGALLELLDVAADRILSAGRQRVIQFVAKRSDLGARILERVLDRSQVLPDEAQFAVNVGHSPGDPSLRGLQRSEEHTSEL